MAYSVTCAIKMPMKKLLTLLAICLFFGTLKAQTADTLKPPPPMPALGLDPDGGAATTPTSDKIYSVVETMPRFPGGDDSLHRYLSRAIVYPANLLKKHAGGTVTVYFVVEKDGSLSNVKAGTSTGLPFNQEAIKAIKPLKFINGIQNGSPVRVASQLKVYFDADNPGFH
jgi:protein TonB